jgi:hypothetical protein
VSESIKKYWHDPVWSKVIAGAILAVTAGISTYFFDWWPIIGRVLKATLDFVLSSTSTPIWLLGILLIPLLLVLIVIGLVIWSKLRPSNQIPIWRNYTKDTFFDIRWTWRYDETNKIIDLYSFCPDCDFQIYPQPNRDFLGQFTHIQFHCENCGRDFGKTQEYVAQFENKVIRHIQRKIRNGSWKTA